MRQQMLMTAAALWLASAGPVWAQDPIHKLGRGLTNALTSWIEIPKQLHVATREGNPVLGAGPGLWNGLKLTGLRLGLGVYEAVTFPLPHPSGYASPYEPRELSDYPWE